MNIYGETLSFARGIQRARDMLDYNAEFTSAPDCAREFNQAAEQSPNYSFESAMRDTARTFEKVEFPEEYWDDTYHEDTRTVAIRELLNDMLVYFDYNAEEDERYWSGREDEEYEGN